MCYGSILFPQNFLCVPMIPVCAKVLTLSLRSKLLAEKMSKHEKET